LARSKQFRKRDKN